MDITVRKTPPLIRSGQASPQRRTAPAVLVVALVAFAGACGPEAPPDTAIRSDSAGVMLVEYPSLPPIGESRIRIAEEPELVLGDGGAFEGPHYDFFQIAGVSQLRDGTLVVADNGSGELRFFGADGHFLRSVGNTGDGPAEFRHMQGPWIIDGDTIVMYDLAHRRLQQFGPDGAYVRATLQGEVSLTEVPFTNPLVRSVLENGRAVVFLHSPMRPTQGAERLPSLVALHRIDDGAWDSVRVVPGREQILELRDGGLGTPAYYFAAYPVAAGAAQTLAIADGARFRVEVFDPDGSLVSVLSASVPEIPVTADVIEGQVEHLMAYRPAWAEGEGAAEYESRIRESLRGGNHAPVLPAIRALFVDADERVWVERYDVPARGTSRWEVFERGGTWIGRVEMPEGFERGMDAGWPLVPYFSVASGRLAGVWTDPDTGLETVRVYRVIEPDS